MRYACRRAQAQPRRVGQSRWEQRRLSRHHRERRHTAGGAPSGAGHRSRRIGKSYVASDRQRFSIRIQRGDHISIVWPKWQRRTIDHATESAADKGSVQLDRRSPSRPLINIRLILDPNVTVTRLTVIAHRQSTAMPASQKRDFQLGPGPALTGSYGGRKRRMLAQVSLPSNLLVPTNRPTTSTCDMMLEMLAEYRDCSVISRDRDFDRLVSR